MELSVARTRRTQAMSRPCSDVVFGWLGSARVKKGIVTYAEVAPAIAQIRSIAASRSIVKIGSAGSLTTSVTFFAMPSRNSIASRVAVKLLPASKRETSPRSSRSNLHSAILARFASFAGLVSAGYQ